MQDANNPLGQGKISSQLGVQADEIPLDVTAIADWSDKTRNEVQQIFQQTTTDSQVIWAMKVARHALRIAVILQLWTYGAVAG